MKKKKKFKILLSSLILIISSITFMAYGDTAFPTPTSYKYANDYVGILDNSTVESIVSIGNELEEKTSAQATIVIIDSTNNVPIEDYANKLFRTWGIGTSDKDNGLLILLAINDKKWKVEVGRGLEGAVPDALSSRVMESSAKPYFKEGNYNQGLVESYSVFCDYIAKEYDVTLDKSLNIKLPEKPNESSDKSASIIGIILVIAFLFDLVFNRGRIFSVLLQLLFWNNINRRGPRGGGGGGFGGFGGGGSSGGSSGGGFGSFGGGSSNGGGSSGSW